MSNELSRWAVAVAQTNKPAYVAVADLISDEIQSGTLAANQRLPTLRKLARALRLNFTTVARGYAEAQRRGLIDTRPGSGTFVREIIASGPIRRSATATLVDMTMNMPPEPRDRAVTQKIREGFAALADDADPYALLRYQEFGGSVEDREAGVHWMSSYVPALTSARVLVCPGIQSALWALCAILAPRIGDSIACEAVTYPGLKGIAAQLGLRLIGLPWDDAGIDPGAFGALCASDLPKALYLNPTLNNPSTATMSTERREAVAEIARRYSVPIIEDDAYGQLPTQRPATLASLAPELTFYITGFAKCLGAGLRIAYIAAPNARYTARIAATMRTTMIMASPPLVRLTTRWIHDGTARAATHAIRQESRARQELARELLRSATYQTKPEAFHLWLDVPEQWTRNEFAMHLNAHGVPVVVSDSFVVAGPAPEAVRVCLGGPADRDDCRHSLGLIEDAIEQLPAVALRGM
jgi:DNA-binding transcriptional MocR family regulator